MDGSARDEPERLVTTAQRTTAERDPLRSELSSILEDAEALGLTVHDDGSVSYPAAYDPAAGGPARDGAARDGPAGEGLTGNGPAGKGPAGNGQAGNGQARGGTLSAAAGFVDEFITEALGITDPNPHRAKAQRIADRIAQVVRRARESGVSTDRGEAVAAAALGPLLTRPGLDSPGSAPQETGPVRASADDCRRSGPQSGRPGI